MSKPKQLVLDANILIRGVFGYSTLQLLNNFESQVSFHSPDVCFEETLKNIPAIAELRGVAVDDALRIYEEITLMVDAIDSVFYSQLEEDASERMARDRTDWPIVATSLLMDSAIWTEDRDFFGCGVATWTTATVGIYLRS